MVTNEAKVQGGSWLPAGWSEQAQIVLVGHAWQPGEDVAQVGERVLAVALAGDDQRVEYGGALAGVGVADEQPVLLADAGWADSVLDEIVVEAAFTVAEMSRQRTPLGQKVIAINARVKLTH